MGVSSRQIETGRDHWRGGVWARSKGQGFRNGRPRGLQVRGCQDAEK